MTLSLFPQYIVAVAFLILLDIVQLGLFFPTIQTHLGHGHGKCIYYLVNID